MKDRNQKEEAKMKNFIGFLRALMEMRNSIPRDGEDNILADVAFIPNRQMTFLIYKN